MKKLQVSEVRKIYINSFRALDKLNIDWSSEYHHKLQDICFDDWRDNKVRITLFRSKTDRCIIFMDMDDFSKLLGFENHTIRFIGDEHHFFPLLRWKKMYVEVIL